MIVWLLALRFMAFPWWMPMMAAAEAGTSDGDPIKQLMPILGWVTTFVVAVIGALGLLTIKKTAKEAGRMEAKAEALLIGPQPFMVQLKEDFPTRREFERLEGEITANKSKMESLVELSTTRMESLFQRTHDQIAAQNTVLTRKIENTAERVGKKIEEVASGAYQARQRIHLTANAQAEKIAAMEVKTDVAAQIEKMGVAIIKAIETTKDS